jgi:diacylglycerol kinase family enzyme
VGVPPGDATKRRDDARIQRGGGRRRRRSIRRSRRGGLVRRPNVLLVNPRSGIFRRDDAALGAVVAAARRHDPDVAVIDCAPDEVTAQAGQAVRDGAALVVACGGDGTLSAAARALAGTAVSFGVVPGGTLNHFARDLGIAPDLEAAIATAFGAFERPVDVGRANATVFINNASIGFYPRLVEEREAREKSLGKWPALGQAVGRVWQAPPTERLGLTVDDGAERVVETSLLFVGNNRYALTLGGGGQRARLDEGILTVCVVPAASQIELLGTAVETLFVGPERAAGVDYAEARRVTVVSPNPTIRVALDGETQVLATPLTFEVVPGALRVRAAP